MTIEVKQIIIKSTVNNKDTGEPQSDVSFVDLEQLKEVMLDECREMISEKLNGFQER